MVSDRKRPEDDFITQDSVESQDVWLSSGSPDTDGDMRLEIHGDSVIYLSHESRRQLIRWLYRYTEMS